MEIVRCNSKEEAQKRARGALNTLLSNTQAPILFLSSGGSALELLEGLSIRKNITISFLDERCSADPAINNFSQVTSRLGERNYINMKRFGKELRTWKERNPTGEIVITQGMGQDGHTAGIMPYPENRKLFKEMFENREHWVVGYDAKEKSDYPLRVTVTMPFLRMADYSIAYIVGEKKREALGRLLKEQGTLAQTPARIMREMKNVKIFTDIV